MAKNKRWDEGTVVQMVQRAHPVNPVVVFFNAMLTFFPAIYFLFSAMLAFLRRSFFHIKASWSGKAIEQYTSRCPANGTGGA